MYVCVCVCTCMCVHTYVQIVRVYMNCVYGCRCTGKRKLSNIKYHLLNRGTQNEKSMLSGHVTKFDQSDWSTVTLLVCCTSLVRWAMLRCV